MLKVSPGHTHASFLMPAWERKLVDQVEQVFAIMGAKWKPAIMLCLVFSGTLRFNELRSAIPDITQKMLTQRLRELERDGLVTRSFHEEIPPRVEYSVTELGMTLHPLFKATCDWGEQNLTKVRRAVTRCEGVRK